MVVARPIAPRNDALEAFLKHCHRKRYPSKCKVMAPGDIGDTLYYIADGSVSVSMHEDDREIVLAYLNRGDFIGEMGVFIGEKPRNVSVITREPCLLAAIAYQRLQYLLEHDLLSYSKELLYVFGRQLSQRLMQTSRKVSDLAFVDVTGRIAHTLLDLCKQPDAITHPDGMQIRITRMQIGRIVGCSREMAGRVLKELEDKKLISVKGKAIVVFGTR